MKADLHPIKISTLPAVYRWKPACWLRVSGSDAATFLQGQFTNELRGLEIGRAVYGLWLSVKGKVLADSFVVRGRAPDEFWIGSYFSPAATIRDRLESYIIADDVGLEDLTATWSALSVLGPLSPSTDLGEAIAFPGRRMREENTEILFPLERAEKFQAKFDGVREIDADEITRMRIAAGIPAVPADIGPTDLPNEAGLDAEAISYTKGCYLGQEVMARLKSMGQVRRRLLRVRGAGERIPPLPAPLFAGGRQVGELRSAAFDGDAGVIGLAMISLLHTPAARAGLAWTLDGAPALHLLDAP